MITKKMSIEEIANRLNTTVERLSKCTPTALADIIEHYNKYAEAEHRYRCDRVLHFLDEDRPQK